MGFEYLAKFCKKFVASLVEYCLIIGHVFYVMVVVEYLFIIYEGRDWDAFYIIIL